MMTEKKTVLLQLGSPRESNVVGELRFKKAEGSARYVVEIQLDQKTREELAAALLKGDVTFTGIVPSALDFYSKPNWKGVPQ